MTFVHVTHSQEEAMALADPVVVMNHGPHRAGRPAARGLQRTRAPNSSRASWARHNVIDTPRRQGGACATTACGSAPRAAPAACRRLVRAVEYQGTYVQVHLVPPGAQRDGAARRALAVLLATQPHVLAHAARSRASSRSPVTGPNADAHRAAA